MIDGHLRCSSTLELSPGLKEEVFLLTPAGRSSELLIENANFRSYRFGPREILACRFIVTVLFESSALVEFHLYPLCDDETVSDWNGFSEEQERRKRAFNDEWLTMILRGSRRTFEWGAVESVFDSRVGASEIIVRYSHPL